MEEARFEVHDLVYKLAHKLSEGECCITSSDQIEKIPSTVLHLALSNKSENFSLTKLKKLIFKWETLRKLKKLRTFKWENFRLSSATLDMILDSLSRSLRVLDLSRSEFEELPGSIGELRDLRYLDVSYNIYLDELPSALFKLSNLETLRFEECGILELPRDFSKLKKLRNLYACTEQVSIPEEIICGLASLRILHLNPVHNLETLPKSLENLTALETLVLRFCSQLTLLDTDIEGVKCLRNLTITHNHKESLIPSSLKDAAASSLSSFCLCHCMGLKTLPDWLVELQRLRRLHVEFCPNLTPSPSPSPKEEIRLPNCLEYLCIRGCPELTKIFESEDWQQKIREIYLDGRIIRPISNTRSSYETSPSSVHVEKDSQDKVKITDVGSSKLPSSSSVPVEEIYEGKAMIQSTPDFESSIPCSSSSEDLIMFDFEDQALEFVGEDNPLTTNIKDQPVYYYRKHHPPMLEDEVWRLEKIGKDGAFHRKLQSEGISTVQDFLKLSVVDTNRLKKILGVGVGMSEKKWEVTIKHAKTCVMGNKYYVLRDANVTFYLNPICQVVKAMHNGPPCPSQDLKRYNKEYVENLVKQAYSRWAALEVVEGLMRDTGTESSTELLEVVEGFMSDTETKSSTESVERNFVSRLFDGIWP